MSEAPQTPRLSRALPFGGDVVQPPDPTHPNLPEKVLQFGTGAFLRGFADAFIDAANRKDTFGGRIVVVGSTGSGRVEQLNRQDGLYTLCIQGLENGRAVDRATVIGSISRAISSQDCWGEVLQCASSADLEVVISNTTEVGIRLDLDDRPDLDPPRSFPGKLTAFLHERGRHFDFDATRGLTILCCELVERNGDRLREIVLTLAMEWDLGEAFVEWLRKANRFCNTLVDRIVPGSPEDSARLFERVGYQDELLIQAEPYALWAIEGDDELQERLQFAASEPSIVVTTDIEPFRKRKVRILNGTHTAMVPLSLLCGNETVKETMDNPLTSEFVRRTMQEEILPTLDLDPTMTAAFADQVLDRYSNPFIRHELLDITLQQTTKMRVRVLPSIVAYFRRRGTLPPALTFAFAAFVHFIVNGPWDGAPADDGAQAIRERWPAGAAQLESFVQITIHDRELWGGELNDLPGFGERVTEWLTTMAADGVESSLRSLLQSVGPAS